MAGAPRSAGWVAGTLVLVGAGLVVDVAVAALLVDGWTNALLVVLLLAIGPAWALPFALVSEETDFPDTPRTRGWWLRVLPWTFVAAPLVVPNVVLLTMFFRDSRADRGRTWLTWDRMRPGTASRDHHWPE